MTNQEMTPHSERTPGKTFIIGAIICLGLVFGGFILVKNFPQEASSQQAIRTLLEERAAALSQKDLERYLRCFSLQYKNGEQSYADLKDSALRWFEQFTDIQFAFQTLRLEIDGNQAFVENNYKFTLQPPEGDVLNISNKELLELRREKKTWKIFKHIKPQ